MKSYRKKKTIKNRKQKTYKIRYTGGATTTPRLVPATGLQQLENASLQLAEAIKLMGGSVKRTPIRRSKPPIRGSIVDQSERVETGNVVLKTNVDTTEAAYIEAKDKYNTAKSEHGEALSAWANDSTNENKMGDDVNKNKLFKQALDNYIDAATKHSEALQKLKSTSNSEEVSKKLETVTPELTRLKKEKHDIENPQSREVSNSTSSISGATNNGNLWSRTNVLGLGGTDESGGSGGASETSKKITSSSPSVNVARSESGEPSKRPVPRLAVARFKRAKNATIGISLSEGGDSIRVPTTKIRSNNSPPGSEGGVTSLNSAEQESFTRFPQNPNPRSRDPLIRGRGRGTSLNNVGPPRSFNKQVEDLAENL